MEKISQEDLRIQVIRPLILKRDGYKCNACGIQHKARVYINTNKTYVQCDELIEAWAVKEGKKVFTIHLNVINVTGQMFSENPVDYLSLCPRHAQQLNMGIVKDFRKMFKEKLAVCKSEKPDVFKHYREVVLQELIVNIKAITNTRITQNQADNIVQNLINTK